MLGLGLIKLQRFRFKGVQCSGPEINSTGTGLLSFCSEPGNREQLGSLGLSRFLLERQPV